MDISSLKPHLGDELFTQVEEKLKSVDGLTVIPTNDGSWVPKTRLDEELGKIKDHRATISTLTKQLEEAKKAGESVTTLQATIDSLKSDIAQRDATITGMKRSGKIQAALVKAKARDAAVVEKLLDASKIGEDDKGNLTGLDDQVKALKESSAYLFEEEGGRKAGFGGGKNPDAGNGGSGSSNSDINAIIRAAAGRGTD
jgi:hypothetical protein